MLLQTVKALLQLLYIICSYQVRTRRSVHYLLLRFTLFCGCRFLCGVTPLELFYSACRVDDLLASGEERVTLGAKINSDLFDRRFRFNAIATCARDYAGHILWVYFLFHLRFSSLFIAHGFKEFFIRLGARHLLSKEFHLLDGIHFREQFAHYP